MSIGYGSILAEEFTIGNNSGYVEGTGELLSDQSASGRERPWAPKKGAVEKMHKLMAKARKVDETIVSESMLDNMKHCGEYLIFKQCPHHSGEKFLQKASFCRHRLCPMCNWRKSLKMFSQMSAIVEKMTDDHSGLRFIFLTLTVRNCKGENLSETIDQMNNAFSLMTGKSKTLAITKGLKKYILGHFKAIEVTYNRIDNTYHPHFHVVLTVPDSYFTRGFTKTEKWVEIWQKCLKVDYRPVIHVETVDMANKGALCEVTKYATKGEYLADDMPEDLASQVVLNLARGLKGKRLVTFGGLFREVRAFLQQDDVEDGDLVHVDGDEGNSDICKICGSKLLEHMYKWRLGAYVN